MSTSVWLSMWELTATALSHETRTQWSSTAKLAGDRIRWTSLGILPVLRFFFFSLFFYLFFFGFFPIIFLFIFWSFFLLVFLFLEKSFQVWCLSSYFAEKNNRGSVVLFSLFGIHLSWDDVVMMVQRCTQTSRFQSSIFVAAVALGVRCRLSFVRWVWTVWAHGRGIHCFSFFGTDFSVHFLRVKMGKWMKRKKME